MTARNGLTALVQNGAIATEQLATAIEVAEIHPDGRAWFCFLNQLFLWSGALALTCAVLFFIAYNWAEMGRYARFGLVEAALVLAIAIYCKVNGRGAVGQAALVAASLLLGGLLALFGQTYQTGADPWQLFFAWAMLMLPWALLGRSVVLWVIWLALLNISTLLYYQTFGGIFPSLVDVELSAYWLLFFLNTTALTIWEWYGTRWQWLAQRWATRLLALGSGIPLTLLAIHATGNYQQWLLTLTLLVYLLWLLALYQVYRKHKPDLFMLAGGCLSAISLIVYWVGKTVFDTFNAGSFLLMALVVLGLSAAAAAWLKQIHLELNA